MLLMCSQLSLFILAAKIFVYTVMTRCNYATPLLNRQMSVNSPKVGSIVPKLFFGGRGGGGGEEKFCS